MSEENRLVIRTCPVGYGWLMLCPKCGKKIKHGRWALVTIDENEKITGAVVDDDGFRCWDKKCEGSNHLNGPMISDDWEKDLKITYVYLAKFAEKVSVIPIGNSWQIWDASPVYVPIKNIEIVNAFLERTLSQ